MGLLDAGFSVQLEHIDTETDFSDMDQHGMISIQSAKGKQLLREGGFQHNRKLRSGGAYDDAAITKLIEAVAAALKSELSKQAVTDVEAVTSSAA